MALMVRGSAFYFGDAVASDNASLPLFYRWVKGRGTEAQWPFVVREGEVEIKRNLFCDINATHFYGIFLSARNAEFQHYVRRDGNRVIVEARATNGNPPVEMNFFAIRLDSNAGLFSHYLGSYRFQSFLKDLWATYRRFVEITKAEELAQLAGGDLDVVDRQYSIRGKCNHGPLYAPGTFENLVERLTSISKVSMSTYEVDGEADRAVSPNLRSLHKEYRLTEVPMNNESKGWLSRIRAETLRTLASGRTVYNGSVTGEDANGLQLTIDFENTLEDYLEFQYDDIGTFEVNNILNHEIIREIITKMQDGILFRPMG